MRDQEESGDQPPRRLLKPCHLEPIHSQGDAALATEVKTERRSGYARTAARCLEGSGTRMTRLVTQAKRHRQINELFLEVLPVSLTGHATLGRLDPGEWLVYTDSPVWASRLRYGLGRLRRQLSDRLKMPVPALRIRIAPSNAPRSPAPRRRMVISEQTARLLTGTARGVADVHLRAALLRLAKRAKSDYQ